jgi:cob(I)alamin adenosyltransferase
MIDPVDTSDEAARNERHAEKMKKRKAFQDRLVASKTVEKGLLMVHTGPGKGKSTAAFGLVLRTAGHGLRVGLVQFIKGAWSTGEQFALERFEDLIDHRVMGEGFTWETQDRARDMAAARRAWGTASAMMEDARYHLIVLDELNIVLRYGYLPTQQVVDELRSRRPELHVLVTGRNAPTALIEAADLVTEMRPIKHHFEAGVKAQIGIEF